MSNNPQEHIASPEDVLLAYRWILGREPENTTKLESHITRPVTIKDLRLRFMRTPEFNAHLRRLGLFDETALESTTKNTNAVSEQRTLFIHVPKTAGTSLFSAFEQALPAGTLSPLRQNDILTRPLIEFSNHSVFFGHFDARMVDLLPGQPKVLTMLREPKARLISLYRYLKSHSAERVNVESLHLAGLARGHALRQFLIEAAKLNPGSVDNAYVRIFGATLPVRRWEDRAEANWLKQQPDDILTYLPAAQKTLQRCHAVGIQEEYAKSLAKFENVLGYSLNGSIEEKVTDQLDNESAGFEQPLSREKLKFEIFEADDILEQFTRGDQILYDNARRLLEQGT